MLGVYSRRFKPMAIELTKIVDDEPAVNKQFLSFKASFYLVL
jgi:hypothetical protein